MEGQAHFFDAGSLRPFRSLRGIVSAPVDRTGGGSSDNTVAAVAGGGGRGGGDGWWHGRRNGWRTWRWGPWARMGGGGGGRGGGMKVAWWRFVRRLRECDARDEGWITRQPMPPVTTSA